MRQLRYVTADVFTSVPFTGNQLAVVFGAEGLPTETLQAITREFNYAESTFVFAPERPDTTRRVRIFTPELELPFAGHPTLGTAHVLVATGEVAPTADDHARGAISVVLGENVGPVPVRVQLDGGVPTHGQFTTAKLPEERVEVTDLDALARVLSLSADDFVGGAHAPTGVDCGVPWLMLPVRSAEAVARARLDHVAWAEVLRDRWAAWPFVFAMTRGDDEAALAPHVRGCDIRARAFVPGSTVPEDPATGSANACLAGYLAARTPRDGTVRWEVAQGVEMGRPSRLSIEADVQQGAVRAVRVGGASIVMCEGTLRL